MSFLEDLSISLTPEEAALVAKSRKVLEGALPQYYDKAKKKLEPISRDFEAFLILSSEKTLSSSTTWLSDIRNRLTISSNEDELRDTYLDLEIDDAITELAACSKELLLFQNFREAISAGKFASVAEVRDVINDSQLGIDNIVYMKDNAKHKLTLASLMKQETYGVGAVASAIKQAESWSGILLNYK